MPIKSGGSGATSSFCLFAEAYFSCGDFISELQPDSNSALHRLAISSAAGMARGLSIQTPARLGERCRCMKCKIGSILDHSKASVGGAIIVERRIRRRTVRTPLALLQDESPPFARPPVR